MPAIAALDRLLGSASGGSGTSVTKGKYRLLVLDGYESYHSDQFKIYYQECNIVTLYIPLYSSYLVNH